MQGSNSPADIVDELATLLTAGRLSRSSRQVIQRIIASESNMTIATMKAQQLMVLTPEFHATNAVRQSAEVRPDPEVPKSLIKTLQSRSLCFIGWWNGFLQSFGPSYVYRSER